MTTPLAAFAGPVLTSMVASWLVWAMAATTLAVPGRDGVVSVLFPLIPIAAGVHLAQWIGELGRWPLVRHGRRTIGPWLMGLTLATLAPAAGLLLVAPTAVGLIALRNVALAAGLAIVVGHLAGEFASQATVFLLAASCWLLGTNLAAPPDVWAIFLHSADRSVSWIVTAVLVAIATSVTIASLRTRNLRNIRLPQR